MKHVIRFFSGLKLILTLRCDESERLISKSMDGQLAFAQRWALRMHFVTCYVCRRFKRHLSILRDAAQLRAENLESELKVSPGLSPESRQRIATILERRSSE